MHFFWLHWVGYGRWGEKWQVLNKHSTCKLAQSPTARLDRHNTKAGKLSQAYPRPLRWLSQWHSMWLQATSSPASTHTYKHTRMHTWVHMNGYTQINEWNIHQLTQTKQKLKQKRQLLPATHWQSVLLPSRIAQEIGLKNLQTKSNVLPLLQQ